jgi:hypothetical protein
VVDGVRSEQGGMAAGEESVDLSIAVAASHIRHVA